MSKVNIWMALSDQALTEFRNRRTQGDQYSGPMDETTYRVLDRMSDQEVVRGMFATPTLAGKTYNLFSVYLEGSTQAKDAIDYITDKWPDHLILVGAWWMDGRQVGTQWELDEEGERTGNVTGTPMYPIPNAAYRIMPPVIVYENGEAVSSTPATSNADLRDINLLQGQAPRRFA